MEYISTAQAAKKWGISVQRVRVLCQEDRILGVTRVGKCYMVPSNAKKPADFRRADSIEEKNEALAPELEMIQRCYENVPEIFYLINPKGYRIVYMNQSARKVFGEEGQNRICYEYVCGLNSVCDYCRVKERVDWKVNYLHEKTKNSYYLFGRRIKVDGQELFGVNGFDITNEVELQNNLEREKKQYEDLYDFVPAGLAVYKKHQNVITMIRINKYLREHTGLGDEMLLDIPIENQMEYIYPDDIKQLVDTLKRCFGTKREQEVLFRFWDYNTKEYRWFNMSIKYGIQKDEDQYAFANYLDVTEQQKMIEELQERKKQLEKAEMHAKIHHLEYDVEKKISILGKDTAFLYGLKAVMENFPREICRPDVLYPADYKIYCENFNVILKQIEDEVTFNVRVRDQIKNRYVWRRIHFVGNYNKDGKIIRINSTSQDINEYLEIEERYIQALVQNKIIAWDYDIDTKKGRLYGNFGNPRTVEDREVYINKFIHPDYRDKIKEMEDKVIQGGENLQEDIPIWNNEYQSYVWHRAIATGIYEPGTKRIQKILCTFKNITNLKNMEREYLKELQKHDSILEMLIWEARINLTKDIVEEMKVQDSARLPKNYQNLTDYKERMGIMLDDIKISNQENIEFSTAMLLEKFRQGNTTFEREYFARRRGTNIYMDIEVEVKMVNRPKDGDVIAFFRCRDIS